MKVFLLFAGLLVLESFVLKNGENATVCQGDILKHFLSYQLSLTKKKNSINTINIVTKTILNNILVLICFIYVYCDQY